ncbi:hypothetical protein TSTA_108920 [Talaromyces stipitatus ATCC 10500]|uniref:Uncharacterized protein n=1 Tax=Talaromyces stipitatus (strain ATCC 10500 / CBS 375.48 / QM 6759 / NRRL 1006) TaxID=441959 RepID=B8MUP3_TALSN|nr:uncharacterized protein TSTA_108920 [Talaromyces stipitatus ATCC 10500]EED11711.1 hypothetical protein TSTA_108920 [Talaromyces stipitatus ATCC 10500]
MLCIRDFSQFAMKCYRSLNPGGSVEISEALLIPYIHDLDPTKLPAFSKLVYRIASKALSLGIDLQNINLKKWSWELEKAGFTIELVARLSRLLHDKIGDIFEARFRQISLRLLTLQEGSFAQAQLDIANAIKELRRDEVRVEWPL